MILTIINVFALVSLLGIICTIVYDLSLSIKIEKLRIKVKNIYFEKFHLQNEDASGTFVFSGLPHLFMGNSYNDAYYKDDKFSFKKDILFGMLYNTDYRREYILSMMLSLTLSWVVALFLIIRYTIHGWEYIRCPAHRKTGLKEGMRASHEELFKWYYQKKDAIRELNQIVQIHEQKLIQDEEKRLSDLKAKEAITNVIWFNKELA